MIFTNPEQIFKILKDNPNAGIVKISREMADSLNKYVTGRGLVEAMEQQPFFEKSDVFKIKKAIAKTTKDIIEKLLQPVDKVFNAKGGVKAYNVATNIDERFTDYLKNVRRGLSVSEWIENVALKAYLIDPMGLIFTEIDENGNAYPTYKCSGTIYDYELKGRIPEYVVFEMCDDEKKQLKQSGIIPKDFTGNVYRVVDDAREYYILQLSKDDYVIAYLYEHSFLKVPAIIVSDIPVYDSPLYESPLMPVMELIASYFRDDTDLQLYKKYQMNPIQWGIELTCPKCQGEKVYKGEDCDMCDGTGQKMHLKASERVSLAIDGDGKVNAPIPPVGFEAPPIEPLQEMVKMLESAKDDIENTFWGTTQDKKSNGTKDVANTATEILIGERKKEPKLKKFSKWGQTVEKHIVDNIKAGMLGDYNPSIIIYGELYLHGTIEEMTDYYNNLVKNNAPTTLLDAALSDVYDSKYSDNPTGLIISKKLMQVEPFVHASVQNVVTWNIPDTIKAQKIYYSEWVKTISDMDLMNKPVDTLRADLLKYATDKGVITPEPAKTGVAA